MTYRGTSMGMPVTINIAEVKSKQEDINGVFKILQKIDDRFSTYKKTSEISQINENKIVEKNYSEEMKKIFRLAEKTKNETNGYFDIKKIDGSLDPSGIVKGYAILEAAEYLQGKGYKNFFVSIAGDTEFIGMNKNKKWKIGIENPFNRKEIVKVISVSNKGIATSGTYIRGLHIYDPINKKQANDIASITVIADNIFNADRFATAAFAMGENGIEFLEKLPGVEGYMIKKDKTAVMTSHFEKFTQVI